MLVLSSTILGESFRNKNSYSPRTQEEENKMSKVPYASAIGSLMYDMVCTQPNIAHVVGVVSRYMSHPRIVHCVERNNISQHVRLIFTVFAM